jgi:Domain of Unknown Function with PDB structure (DUF3857)
MNRTQRFIYAVVFFLVVLCAASSRRSFAGAGDWLPIPPADLALQDNPASPGAHAMILYRGSDMDSQESSVLEYIRIKIFTQEGTKEGDIEIPFLKQQSDIKDIRARTIQPNGAIVNFDGKVFEKTIVKGNGFKYLAKTFTLPDVHPGSIIEYKYREQSDPNRYVNNSWILTNSLFTRDAHFTIKPVTGADSLALSYRQVGLPAGAVPVRQSNGTYAMDVHNIAGLEQEDYMPPERALQARVDFYYKNPGDPANETPAQFWNRNGKQWAEELDHFVGKKSALESDLSRTVAPTDTPEQKLRKIYARVQKIRNLSMEDSKTEKEAKQEQIKPNSNVEDVLKHNYATARQLNYTFVGLARTAGFSANDVLLASRNLNFFIPDTLDVSLLNADIVWVHAGAQDYYLDPAASTYPFGILPWYETSTRGIRYSKEGGEVVAVPPALPSQGTVARNIQLVIDSDGEATGKLQVDFTGILGAWRREQNHSADEAGRSKTIGDEIKSWLPPGSTYDVTAITNWADNELPVHVEGAVKIPGLGTAAGRRMLIPASAFQARQAASFHPEKRLYPVYIFSPYEEIDDAKLTAPDGFKIEAVPPAKQLKPGVISYEISAAQQANVVEVKRLLIIDGMMFPVKNYPALRNFFNSVKSNDETQIVLQNAETAKNN